MKGVEGRRRQQVGTDREVHTGETVGVRRRCKKPSLIAPKGLVAEGVVPRFIN